ncbi:MAG TPA: anthranilate synthase component I family protein [Thermoanaerobaculia bacterium]|nr:anthranilate synthase component I family protein [Thermoanaerobaculia bacterium]
MTTSTSTSARVLVVEERPADLTTPVAVMRSLLRGTEPCFLLESVEGGERVARWSFLGTAPSRAISGRTEDPFVALRSLENAAPRLDDLPPFTGGAVGYAGYDFARRLEKLPSENDDTVGMPDAWFGVFDEIIAFDHVKHRLLFIGHAEKGAERGVRERLVTLAARVLKDAPVSIDGAAGSAADFVESMPREAFLEAVEKAKEHIRAGDIFQVVLSRRWSTPFAGDPFSVYRALRRVSPSPYQYFVRTPDGVVFGASPERLVRVARGEHGAEVETIPLAGTRPRGTDRESDERLEKELLADPKERAEHVMLVDLGRNDLGRVSIPGTVSVKDFFTVERYSHVMHIASRVTGRLRPDKDALDALAATFPAGTLTGAPKIRAMEIIESLEPVRRGPYGGAVGYVDFAGNLDVAIAIRTAVVAGGRLHVQAGAGIVADSVPEAEADECENKARAMMRAVALSADYA